EFAERLGVDFAVGAGLDLVFDVVDHLLDALVGDGALDARHADAGQHLLAVIGLAPSIVLHHRERGGFHIFIRGVALAAFEAFTPTPDGLPAAACAGVDDLVFIALAVRAFHGGTSGGQDDHGRPEYTPIPGVNQHGC